jgi:hypothetical protein
MTLCEGDGRASVSTPFLKGVAIAEEGRRPACSELQHLQSKPSSQDFQNAPNFYKLTGRLSPQARQNPSLP